MHTCNVSPVSLKRSQVYETGDCTLLLRASSMIQDVWDSLLHVWLAKCSLGKLFLVALCCYTGSVKTTSSHRTTNNKSHTSFFVMTLAMFSAYFAISTAVARMLKITRCVTDLTFLRVPFIKLHCPEHHVILQMNI